MTSEGDLKLRIGSLPEEVVVLESARAPSSFLAHMVPFASITFEGTYGP